MGINSVAVVGPRSEPQKVEKQKKDPLDTILQGLQIAQGISGIAVNYQNFNRLRAENANLADERAGVQPAKDQQSALAQGLQPVPENTPGSTLLSFRAGEGDEGIRKQAYIMQKAKSEDKGSLQQVQGPDGSPMYALVTGKEQTPYKPYNKPETNKYSVQTDHDGKIWRVNTTTGEASEVKTGEARFGKGGKPLLSTYEEKVNALKSGDRQRFDSAAMGLHAVNEMGQALADGDWTFSPVGDNDYTRASTMFEESLGRMQSGGVIGKDEAERFRGMAPKATDSAEMQATKLKELYAEMALRVKSMGFDPDEVLTARKEQLTATPEFKSKDTDGTALAGTKTKEPPKKDPTIEKFAADHDIPYEQADAIIADRKQKASDAKGPKK